MRSPPKLDYAIGRDRFWTFFIRKAIGWALRECSKKYPEEVFAFLERIGGRASGLTRREGSRRLPEQLQAKLKRSLK